MNKLPLLNATQVFFLPHQVVPVRAILRELDRSASVSNPLLYFVLVDLANEKLYRHVIDYNTYCSYELVEDSPWGAELVKNNKFFDPHHPLEIAKFNALPRYELNFPISTTAVALFKRLCTYDFAWRTALELELAKAQADAKSQEDLNNFKPSTLAQLSAVKTYQSTPLSLELPLESYTLLRETLKDWTEQKLINADRIPEAFKETSPTPTQVSVEVSTRSLIPLAIDPLYLLLGVAAQKADLALWKFLVHMYKIHNPKLMEKWGITLLAHDLPSGFKLNVAPFDRILDIALQVPDRQKWLVEPTIELGLFNHLCFNAGRLRVTKDNLKRYTDFSAEECQPMGAIHTFLTLAMVANAVSNTTQFYPLIKGLAPVLSTPPLADLLITLRLVNFELDPRFVNLLQRLGVSEADFKAAEEKIEPYLPKPTERKLPSRSRL